MLKKLLNQFEIFSNDLHLMEILKGISIAIIVRVFAIISSYFFTFFIARYYGAEAMGLFATSQTIILLICLFSRLGLDTASIKFISELNSKESFNQITKIYFKIIALVLSFSIILSIVLYFSSNFIGIHLMGKPEMVHLLKISSFSIIPITLLFINSESFRGMKNILYYSIFRNMTTPFISVIILLIFYSLGMHSYEFPLYSYIISSLTLFLVSSILWINSLNFKNDLKPAIPIRKMLDVSMPMLFTSSMIYILQWTGIIILSFFVSQKDIGIYNVAIRISFVTNLSLFAINSIVAPKFSELYSQNKMSEFRKVITNSSKLIFFSSFPIILLFIFFPSFFLSLFGDEFVAGRLSLIIFSFGGLINAVSGSIGYILQMTGKEKIFRNIMILSTILNIVLNILLVPKYGIEGSAIANTLSVLVWKITGMYVIKKEYNVLTLYLPKFLKRL